ncbi:MAG: GNAT family N-acetyltransferase [Caldilineae bacterium]|nr:MAG: GNAT family N-acetyltransferase [Caldilineae bacterium]
MRDPLYVRTLYPPDGRQIQGLLMAHLAATPYCSAMDEAQVQEQCFLPAPPGVHEVQWLRHQVLGAMVDERLIGFIHIGVGFDQETLHLVGRRPFGLLRFLALPQEYLSAGRTARLLLQAADDYWREQGVAWVRAFTLSTGYPAFQLGAGLLPAAWEDHLRWLTEAGYRLVERYYTMRFPLERLIMEPLPAVGCTFWPRSQGPERHYQLFDGETLLGYARTLERTVMEPAEANPVAYLSDLGVAKAQREQGVDRWLLRRLINDATLRGCRDLVAHVNHRDRHRFTLFSGAGFEETATRGYTLEKQL